MSRMDSSPSPFFRKCVTSLGGSNSVHVSLGTPESGARLPKVKAASFSSGSSANKWSAMRKWLIQVPKTMRSYQKHSAGQVSSQTLEQVFTRYIGAPPVYLI